MRSFFQTYGGARWVVDAFEDWIFSEHSPLRKTIRELPEVKTKDGMLVSLRDAEIVPTPQQTPHSCRLQRQTYSLDLMCSLCVNGERMPGKICVARIPRMVNENSFDAGYFIIDGVERAFVNRESMRYDVPKFKHVPSKNKYAWYVDLSSLDAPLTMTHYSHTKRVTLAIGFDHVQIPLHILVRALDPNAVAPEEEKEEEDEEEEDAMFAMGKALLKNRVDGLSRARVCAHAKDTLEHRVLPYLKDFKEKSEFLLSVSSDLMDFAHGKRDPTDLDAMENKRIDTAGKFIARLTCAQIRDVWTRAKRSMFPRSDAKDAHKCVRPDVVLYHVCKQMKSAFDDKCASVLPRKASWQEALSVVRRVNADVGEASVSPGPRMFHGTWYGFYCACETPEGARTGLSRDTALFFKCSPHGDASAWRDFISAQSFTSGLGRLFINRSECVKDANVEDMERACRKYKRERDPYASVVRRGRDVLVDVTEGRALRAVWTPNSSRRDYGSFHDLIRNGEAEWIDAQESAQILISTTHVIQNQYMELHPCSLFGLSAANIPFADHNAGARNLFGAHVRHQAVGFPYPYCPEPRFDTDETHRLWYAQRALCDTEPARLMQSHTYPNGWNAVIFVLAKAHGQEDSMGIAKRHVDLGAGVIETEISMEETVHFPTEWFGRANEHAKLDVDGLPRVGEILYPNDVIISKRNALGETSVVRWTKKFPARVRHVCRTGDVTVLIKLAWRRTPEIGDKLASRHGQKGVINFFVYDETTYWTKDGVTPDIIMNPAAFPSRMTMGHMFEMMCGKINALRPPPKWTARGCVESPTDCTPYSSTFSFERAQDMLREAGFQHKGHELVYNGSTGELMKDCHVFIGPAFIQRLVHFSFTKCYARGRGARNAQTGQPPKGRRNDGGLRLGEGETKAAEAHGAASSLRTAHMECSDGIEIWMCASCHEPNSKFPCALCRGESMYKKIVPRAFLLLRDQLRVARVWADVR